VDKIKQKSYEGMKKVREDRGFPRDRDTLCIIREMEACLGLKSKDIDKMINAGLTEYIGQLALMLLKK
jgi:hypothetical protein